MNNLYAIAINELEKLLSQAQSDSGFSIEKPFRSESEYELYSKRRDRNSFNQLPLNVIEKFEVNNSFAEELADFIEILKILKNVDSEFRELIKSYTHITEYNREYEYIQEKLESNITNFADSKRSTENPSIILMASLKDLFLKKYKRRNLSNMYFYFYNTLFAYISEYYNHLLNELANYYVKQVCIGILGNETAKEFIHKNKELGKPTRQYLDIGEKFTFLSYAFHDKLISFLLFLEAKVNGIVLFVDWMYSCDLSKHPIKLKRNLNEFLHASNKLVFLRSINSELNTYVETRGLFRRKNRMVRQWCSWEMGNFYNHTSIEDSSIIKYQYNLHQDVNHIFKSNQRDVEENILLFNLKKINRMQDLY